MIHITEVPFFLHLPGSSYGKFVESCAYLNSLIPRIEALCPGHNECFAPKDDMTFLHEATNDVNLDQIKFDVNNESKLYQFEHF